MPSPLPPPPLNPADFFRMDCCHRCIFSGSCDKSPAMILICLKLCFYREKVV